MSDPKGLVFTLVESGPNIPEEEYRGISNLITSLGISNIDRLIRILDWYDNEHAPARITIPSFYSAARFKANDGLKPTSLTLYEISEPSVANGPEYQAIFANGSERDKRMVPALQYLTRRSYSVTHLVSHSEASLPPKFIFYEAVEVKPEGEASFDRWLKEEHIPLIAKTPGWSRSRLLTLEEQILFGGSIERHVPLYKYLAIHDFSSGGYRESAEVKAAISTPWKDTIGSEVRHFEFEKSYTKQK
ncbi:hypothetical protein D9757_009594 [Collybiopsis confluens]|uniref:Uncharacterized protein n=1 Tax=Collybiopsis confluens TaxID=2823264 RepID=A0A8H5H4J3_9AGAR|nr:hypothetical protein D9757_009594 [Collybiopsis confluens]